MESNLDKIALDLYGKIQTRFNDIKIGDENAKVLSKKEDIPHARFFEFEYEENGEPLGTVAITLDASDGIIVQVSGDLVNDGDGSTHRGAYRFLRSFRQFAKDRLLNFDIQNIGKSNLDKRDYQFQAKRKEEPVMPQQPVMENKMYGNAKISYQDLGEARLVVKHNAPINLDLPAGRTMHIESIYIENAVGERFKYPFKHLNGARALAEHIKHGGNPYDPIGKHITGLSEELASLRKFKGFVSRQEQISEAMGSVTDRVIERIQEIKETINKLQRSAYYETFAESFEAQEEQVIPEEIQNDLINRLTVRTFNEELKSVFPYIAKFVKESELPIVEVTADDLLSEAGYEDELEDRAKAYHKGHADYKEKYKGSASDRVHDKRYVDDYITGYNDAERFEKQKSKKETYSPEDQFESFINNIVEAGEGSNTLFSSDVETRTAALQKLQKLLAPGLKAGVNGMNAIASLRGIIDSNYLEDELQGLEGDDDAGVAVKLYLTNLANGDIEEPELPEAVEIAQELLASNALDVSSSEGPVGGQDMNAPPPETAPLAPAPAPAPAPAAAPAELPPAGAPMEPMAAPAPVAEGDDNKGSWKSETPWKKVDPKKNPEGKVHNLAGQALKKTIEKAKKAGATLETQLDFGHGVKTLAEIIAECGMEPADVGFDNPEDNASGVDQILKSIAGFWNSKERNFTIGGTRAKTKVVKDFKDGAFPNASEDDVKHVLSMIEKMDPSSNEHNQIIRLAGVGHSHEITEDPTSDKFAQIMNAFKQEHPNANITQLAQQFQQGAKPAGAPSADDNSYERRLNAPSTVGQPTSDPLDAMKNLKVKFGDREFDTSKPDDMERNVKGMVGDIFGKLQGQVPKGPQELPQGMGNVDFSKMLDLIKTNAGLK